MWGSLTSTVLGTSSSSSPPTPPSSSLHTLKSRTTTEQRHLFSSELFLAMKRRRISMFGFIFIPFLNRYYPSDEFHLGVPYVLLKRDLSQPEGAFSDTKEAVHAKMAFEGNNNEEINIHVKPHCI